MTDPALMDRCLFVDAVGQARESIVQRAVDFHGALPACSTRRGARETIRFDFEALPDRADLLSLCEGSLRAASLQDAELEWLVGGPIGGGRLLWTLTEILTPGDQHGPAN